VGPRTRSKGFKRTKWLSVKNLLADASEPPAVTRDAVAAADIHATLAAPAAERGEAPLAFAILPMSAVGVLIGEGGVVGVHLGK